MEVLHQLLVVETHLRIYSQSLLQPLSGQTEGKGSVKPSLNIVQFSVIYNVDLDCRANLGNGREGDMVLRLFYNVQTEVGHSLFSGLNAGRLHAHIHSSNLKSYYCIPNFFQYPNA